jgi:SAM-dependent methyltransferase
MIQRTQMAVGCDLDLPALQRHRSLTHRLCATLQGLPFRDGSFDILTLNYVVEHLEQPSEVFAELVRVLGPNGRLIVLTPNAASYYIRLTRFGQRLLPRSFVLWWIRYLEERKPEDVFPAFYRANTRRRLSELLTRAGMIEEEISLLNDQPLFHFAAPLSAVELLFSRLLMWVGLRELAAVSILAAYRRRPSVEPGP